MVFESLVADLLNRYAGKYIENLDHKQLKIGIWGGDVVLKNLKLREDAFDDLNLPIKLLHGYVGKWVLKIPWKNLYSQAIVAQIEDLHVLIASRQMVEYNAEKEEELQYLAKQKSLRALDEIHQKELEQGKTEDPTLQEKLTARIVNNMQVKIANVHIRYEDTTTTVAPFAVGITLHNLELYTTDEHWDKCFITDVMSRVFKILSIDSFSFYMNCNSTTYNTSSSDEIIELFRTNIASKDVVPLGYEYVLGPISAQSKLCLNLNPSNDDPPFVIPKLNLRLELEAVNLAISTSQNRVIINLLDAFDRMSRGAPYRPYRPYNTAYKGNAKIWWKFAITAVLEVDVRKRRRQWLWSHIHEHLNICKNYAKAHKQRCLTNKPAATILELCKLAEKKLDLFNLTLIRKRVQFEVDRIKEEEADKKEEQKKVGWFGGWFSSKHEYDTDESNIKKKFEAAMTPQEKMKLYAAIGYQENTAPLELPEHYEAICMSFKLNTLDVTLYKDNCAVERDTPLATTETLLKMTNSTVMAVIKQRPAANAFSIKCTMNKLKVTGYKVEHRPLPVLVDSKLLEETNLLDFFFETNPLDKLCNQRLKLNTRPLQIVYDSKTILELIRYFTPKDKVNLKTIEGAATLKIANFKERSTTGLTYIIENHEILDIDITLMPNVFILPHNGTYKHERSSMIVISFGKVHIFSQPSRHTTEKIEDLLNVGAQQNAHMKVVMEKAYDLYKLTIDDVQVFISKPRENWESFLKSSLDSRLYVLQPTTLIIDVKICVVADDPRLPKTRVQILLPSITLNFVDERIMEALKIVMSIPLPEKDITPIEPSRKAALRKTTSYLNTKSSKPHFLNQTQRRKRLVNNATVTEAVQYTSIEVDFALEEFSIVLFKGAPQTATITSLESDNLSNVDDDSFSTPVEEHLEDSKTITSEFFDTKSQNLSNNAQIVRQLSLQILQLEVHMAQRTFETIIKAALGAISLKFYENKPNKDELESVMIETPRFIHHKEPLLSVSYVMVDRATPDFAFKYKSIVQFLEVKFAILNIILHQENILDILELIEQLKYKVEEINPKYLNEELQQPKDRIVSADEESIWKRLSSVAEESSSLANSTIDGEITLKPLQPGTAKIIESVDLKLIAEMKQVGLELTCKKRSLARLKISSLYAGVIVKSAYTEVELGLKDITLEDMNPVSRHSNFLSIVGNDALTGKVVLFNADEMKLLNNKIDMQIDFSVGCMKIIFINSFVVSILHFLENFQVTQEAIAAASARAADAAKQNVLEYHNATRTKLNIKVKAPVIIIPVHSQSFEALLIDMGQLNINNILSETPINASIERNKIKNVVVYDEIKIILTEMKIRRVEILNTQATTKTVKIQGEDEVDYDLAFKSNANILNSSNFVLNFKRNLSFDWYKEVAQFDLSGSLKPLDVYLYVTDYGLIISILNGNMKEGADEFQRPQYKETTSQRRSQWRVTPPPTPITTLKGSPLNKALDKFTDREKGKAAPSKMRTYEQLKYNLQLDGIIFNLMTKNTVGLARFGIYFISLKGNKLEDGTLTTNIILCNMQLEDTRPDVNSEITTYLCRKDCVSVSSKELAKSESTLIEQVNSYSHDTVHMLDFTCVSKENKIVVKIRLTSFELILCVDFLLKLSTFFQTADITEAIVPKREKDILPTEAHDVNHTTTKYEKSEESTQTKSEVVAALKCSNATKASFTKHTNFKEPVKENKNQSKVDINVHAIVDEPNIILVENLADMNTSAIIFNFHCELNHRSTDGKQILKGSVDGLKMYMCSFLPERRESTRHYILHPCVITLQGSTPVDEGLHVSITFSDIIINISPASLELVHKALQSISSQSVDKTKKAHKSNYENIWEPKMFENDEYWFVQVDEAEEAIEHSVLDKSEIISENSTIAAVKDERCILEMPCVVLVLETGIGYYAHPVISIDTRLNVITKNWSSFLSANGSLCLSMNYYNQTLGVWEPVIELNEQIAKSGARQLVPWELNFSLGTETSTSVISTDNEEHTQVIRVSTAENLEITFSKTFLNILVKLKAAFNQAMDPKGLIKPDVIAPYVVENNTGFDITLNLARGIFTLHDSHIPNASPSRYLNRSLVFHTKWNAMKMNFMPEDVKTCTISPGGKVFLQTKSLSSLSSPEDEEYNLYVQVNNVHNTLVLPVTKVDIRYFPLHRNNNQEPWGIVSEVTSEYGTTVVNIHGILDVFNHFTTSVEVYRMKSRNREMMLIGIVPPNSTFHVPLRAIHTELKFIHFGIEEYTISAQGIKWDESLTDMNYSRVLQCDPKHTYEPFYIHVNREKTEIYHEHTNKFKLLSAYYTLHLRPPLYLRNALPIDITVSMAGCSYRDVDVEDHSTNQIRHSAISETNVPSSKSGFPNTNKYFDAYVELTSSSSSTEEQYPSLQVPYGSDYTVKEDLLNYGEKEVESGTILQLPTLKLAGHNRDLKTFLVVKMIQYLEKDWSCTTEIPEEHKEFAVWKFNSFDSEKKMTTELCVKFDDRFGSIIITLFSPYWFINKTGQMLSYTTRSESVEVLYHPPEYTGPILYSLREKHLFSKQSCSVRVDNSEWSTKIPLDVAGSMGSVSCKAGELTYQVGVHNHLTHNSLTKQIIFIPFYTITNKCSFLIEIQEHTRPADPWKKISLGHTLPWWPKNDSDHMVVVKVGKHRSVPFKYNEPVRTLLQLKDNKFGGVNVEVQTTEGGVYITFTEYYEGDAPGLLMNHTSVPVKYREKNIGSEQVLLPNQMVLYTWADPAGERCLIFGKNQVETDLRRDGIGSLNLENNITAYWVSFLNGLQRVLLFTECENVALRSESTAALQTISQTIQMKIHGIGLSLLNNETGAEILYLGITSSGIIWETKKERKNRFTQMNIHDTAIIEALYQKYLLDKGFNQETDTPYMLDEKQQIDFDEMSLTKPSGKRLLRRTFLPGVWISLDSSPFQTQIHIKINRIQVDNQLFDCMFPVVLAPIPPPKTLAKTTLFKPFIECSVVQRIVPHSTVQQFKYASMLVQEFHIKADLLLVIALLNFLTTQRTEEEEVQLFKQNVDSIDKPLKELVQFHSQQEQKSFYDHLHLGPMKVHISFSLAGIEPSALPGLLSRFVQGIGVTLTDVNDVVIRLAFFEREYLFFTQDQLISDITSHYTGQALKQIYVLVLGLDVLGNPFGLVVGLKKGVEDLFYEPFQGAIQGPGEFAEGLVLGVRSLFGHTIGGAAGAVSKITGAMGKGLAVLTFDDDYQKKRRQLMISKPKTFQEGMARSGRGLVMGFVDGVTGVVTKPLTGAREEGVEGFFKGLGKGTIGLVTRPTAGIVDFAHGTFDSVKRATEINTESKRLRPPRFFHPDKTIRPYCLADAKGNKMLREVDKGKYATTDSFVHCEKIDASHDYLLVTNHRLLYITHNDVFGSWTVVWACLYKEIARIAANDKGLEIQIRKDNKKVLGLFAGNDVHYKHIPIGQKERRENCLHIIEGQRFST